MVDGRMVIENDTSVTCKQKYMFEKVYFTNLELSSGLIVLHSRTQDSFAVEKTA